VFSRTEMDGVQPSSTVVGALLRAIYIQYMVSKVKLCLR
jgi:hypothetical protein